MSKARWVPDPNPRWKPSPGFVDGESGGMFEKQAAGNYITAGSFGRAVLLNGLDAPTGGQAQSNPSPVLLRLIEPVTLASNALASICPVLEISLPRIPALPSSPPRGGR